MAAKRDGVDEAFARLDKERLLEITYLAAGGRTFRGDRQNFLSFMNTLRKEGESGFCDVVLEVDGQFFPAHRCVLAANSQFFYTLFTSGMKDSNEKHIKLCSVSSSALSIILDFFYTRDIVINKDNADELLEAASFLLLNHVKNACAAIISVNLSINNCFSTKRLADRYALDDLKKRADAFMKEHFQSAKLEKEFYDLHPWELKELISSDSVRVEKEEEVFEAVLSWAKHDPTNRTKDLSTLLPCLRYGSLSPSFVEEHFQTEPLLEDNEFCQNYLKQQRRRKRTARSKKKPGCSKERPSAKVHNVVIGVGRGNLRTSFCYDVENELIYKLPDPPSPYFQLGITAIGRELYTVSRDRHDWDDNASTLMQHKLAPNLKLTERYWSQVNEEFLRPNTCSDKSILLSLKGKLYIVGGCSGIGDRIMDIQCYDPSEKEWKAMSKMNTSRCMIGAVATDSHIYVIGGRKGHIGAPENVVERFDPEANYWTTVASMNTARSKPEVAVTTSYIFALGGLSGSVGAICEIYKIASDKWTAVTAPPTRTPKITLSINDEVYVIAGGETWKYFKKRNSWKKSAMFRTLHYGFDEFNFVQLKLPKFCYEQYYRMSAHNLVSYNRNIYDCSSDDDEEESDYRDPWFYWGDDSSESEW